MEQRTAQMQIADCNVRSESVIGPLSEGDSVVDLYSGSGAVTAALKLGGFHVSVAIDSDPVACASYRLNHPEVHLIEKDIREIDPIKLAVQGTCNALIGLLIVCAPCQPFSSQNRKRGQDDRSDLVLQAPRFAEVLRPHCILFENVAGFMSDANSTILDQLTTQLQELGYQLSKPQKVNAAEVGVPQRRLRCMMIASRSVDAIRVFDSLTLPKSRKTVREAIGHLSELKQGEKDDKDSLHRARKHHPISLKRLAAISKNGGSRSELPPHLALRCHAKRSASSFPDVYGRMKWDDVAPTLTTGCTDITKGRFAHPEQDRAISLREAALLQTFPPAYQFSGNSSEIATQIGNAVPVELMKALVPTIRDLIELGKKAGESTESPKYEM